MKLYKDASLKEEITELDLGTCLAGDKQEYTYYLYNDTNAEVKELKLSVENSEVKIISYPETLKRKETGKLVISWEPSITIKAGLKTKINLKGFELYS